MAHSFYGIFWSHKIIMIRFCREWGKLQFKVYASVYQVLTLNSFFSNKYQKYSIEYSHTPNKNSKHALYVLMANFERVMVQQVVDSLQCAFAICESSRTWHARTRYGVCEVTPRFSTRVPYAGRGVAGDWRSLHDQDTEGEILFSRRIRQGNVHPRSPQNKLLL